MNFQLFPARKSLFSLGLCTKFVQHDESPPSDRVVDSVRRREPDKNETLSGGEMCGLIPLFVVSTFASVIIFFPEQTEKRYINLLLRSLRQRKKDETRSRPDLPYLYTGLK